VVFVAGEVIRNLSEEDVQRVAQRIARYGAGGREKRDCWNEWCCPGRCGFFTPLAIGAVVAFAILSFFFALWAWQASLYVGAQHVYTMSGALANTPYASVLAGTTPMQMKMLLTRLGENASMVVTGDLTQIDLPRGEASGLREATRILRGVEGISFVHFDKADVVRHPFDPSTSEALQVEDTGEYEDGVVIREVMAGYRFKDRVVRPARVIVARNSSANAAAEPGDEK